MPRFVTPWSVADRDRSAAKPSGRRRASGSPPPYRPVGRTVPGILAALAITTLSCPSPARADASPLPPLGSPTAPVEIVEWGDFQCPLCAAFTRDTQPALTRAYFATGLARLDWRDFANHGPESVDAAVAARAAARQGAFWPYHDYLLAHQYGENSGAWNPLFFLRAAQSLHLDVPRFAADLADPALRDAVLAQSAEARRQAPAGTPTFTVNGQAVIGARAADVFRKAVEAALAKARATGAPGHHITRPAHRPRPTAAARPPSPGPSARPSAPHGPARPTSAPDAPRASGA